MMLMMILVSGSLSIVINYSVFSLFLRLKSLRLSFKFKGRKGALNVGIYESATVLRNSCYVLFVEWSPHPLLLHHSDLLLCHHRV